MSPRSDTIAALATPTGTSALALLRVSGPESRRLFEAIFGQGPQVRRAMHVRWGVVGGGVADEGVAVFFAGPASFTGEDSFEYTGHGNPLLVQQLLADLLTRGCRSAEPGEFTRRAFTHGKLDLSQAEAVVDLIHAQSERALVVANQQLNGSLGRHLAPLTDTLLQALARIEAYIDFPEEDLPEEDQALVDALLADVERGTQRLLATERYGHLLREGIRTVLLGEPNAGKSSLLNRLVGQERALVSPEPGTTRDFIEERLHVGTHCLRLIDTAGLNPAPGEIERRGIAKTHEKAEEADLLLVVVDSSRPFPPLPESVVRHLRPERTIVIQNKTDLLLGAKPVAEAPFPALATLAVSALTGTGIESLTAAITDFADRHAHTVGEDLLAINARHADALGRAQAGLQSARRHLREQGPTELLASDVRSALDALGEIGGRIDNERMLDALFKTFCIGK